MYTEETADTVIRVSNLTKAFGSTRAVDSINFEVRKGTIFALLGPNGAGKTTTISILEGLRKEDSGKVTILGMDPWKEHEKLKLKIGVIPQDFNFFEKLTPLDSIRFYRDVFGAGTNLKELLKLVVLGGSMNVPFEKLSGGQKQKLGLALSLVNNPDILFLDEPTTGLDPAARRAIWAIIRSFREQGKTIVLTTHYMEEAEQLADSVAIMNRGKIVAMGTLDEILSEYGSGKKLIIKAGKEMLEHLEQRNIKAEGNGGTLEIKLYPETNLSAIIAVIENSGIEYSQLTVRTDNLEDIFIRLVGTMAEGELQ